MTKGRAGRSSKKSRKSSQQDPFDIDVMPAKSRQGSYEQDEGDTPSESDEDWEAAVLRYSMIMDQAREWLDELDYIASDGLADRHILLDTEVLLHLRDILAGKLVDDADINRAVADEDDTDFDDED